MSLANPHEVFLSHSSLDREFATYLASTLRRHGVPVWYSQTNVVGAQSGKTRSVRHLNVATGL
jgi:TIR domain